MSTDTIFWAFIVGGNFLTASMMSTVEVDPTIKGLRAARRIAWNFIKITIGSYALLFAFGVGMFVSLFGWILLFMSIRELCIKLFTKEVIVEKKYWYPGCDFQL